MSKKKYIKQPQVEKKSNIVEKSFSWWKFSIKIILLFLAVLLVVIYTDKKGYFTADQKNNHIKRKWASFYDYTQKKEVDVIILGNSHIITGVDPFVLSDATSSTCYILGNSGTGIIDAWFQLGEALKHTHPKLVILETYCINNEEKFGGNITPYLQSFDAQNDVLYKLKRMPQLFNSDSWVSAWSPSIRNHSFLLTDTERINYNIKNPKEHKSKKLDLGRFARFGFGLQDSTLAKYDSIGAPANGKEFQISAFSKKYLKEIMEICEAKGIPLLFLTIPMYYKHVAHYDSWKATLNEELKKYPNSKWFDLQMPYDTLLYTPSMFENTYKENQHLSNLGMMVTAYKLAGYIDENYPNLLPDRSKDQKWINDFKTSTHFVYNQNIADGMKGFTSIIKDKQIGDFHIRELAMQVNKESDRVILKIDKHENLRDTLTVQYSITMQGNDFITPIKMYKMKGIFPPKHEVYFIDVRKDVKIREIVNIENK
ncbi:MAG: hypothetical protein H3C31_03525 [Brumimicrobium sp.]|nr:hypothetical protein [Brumimicrobium sp.]